jgi:hypothetical protein
MLNQLKMLLKRRSRVSTHPIFGDLRYESWRPAWHGEFFRKDTKLILSIGGTKQRPNKKLTELAVEVVNRLAEIEQLALSFQSTLPRAFTSDKLQLNGVDLFYLSKSWISQTLARHNPSALQVVKLNEAMFSLEFSVAEDRNVLDVIFTRETPVDADYH